MARPMPLFAPVTTPIQLGDILNSYNDSDKVTIESKESRDCAAEKTEVYSDLICRIPEAL